MRGPPSRRWGAHEICLLFLGAGTATALGVCASPSDPAFFEALAATVLFGAFTGYLGHAKSPRLQKLRLSATVAFVVWFYMALGRIAPVLGLPWRDESLQSTSPLKILIQLASSERGRWPGCRCNT